MKKVKYIGEGGLNVGEYFPQISWQPEVGDIHEVPDWWEHPRTEEIKEIESEVEPETAA
jgi:hypothetical protein